MGLTFPISWVSAISSGLMLTLAARRRGFLARGLCLGTSASAEPQRRQPAPDLKLLGFVSAAIKAGA